MPPKSDTLNADEIATLLRSPGIQRLASQAFDPLPESGPLRVEADGGIVLELTDVVIKFRHPTLGEYRAILEAGKAIEAAKGEDDDVAALAWWRKTAEILGDSPLPEDDALPVWLTSPVYPRQAQNTWVTRPTQAPGT